MSISKRVCEAIDKAVAGDYEAALIPACIAVDATAKQENPSKHNKDSYKCFLHDNLWIIGYTGLRMIIARDIRMQCSNPNVRLGPDGTCSLQDVLYYVIRCGLLHSATIKNEIELSDTIVLGADGPKVTITKNIVWGLVFAVVLAPSNAGEKAEDRYSLSVDGNTQSLNSWWGTRNEFARYVTGEVQKAMGLGSQQS